jgi:NTP pyrophosphatase (non-canonical NTP hydrolase)
MTERLATQLAINSFPHKGSMTILDMQRDSCRIAQDHGFWELYDIAMSSEAAACEMGDPQTPGLYEVIIDSKLMLIVGEIAEAEEALRHGKPQPEFAEELADAMIRIGDLAHKMGINLEAAIAAKQAYNETRPYMHGKRF